MDTGGLLDWLVESPTLIAALISAIAPTTAFIVARATIKREEEQHRHQVAKEKLEQEHGIISSYLDRALDPETPLAIRQQLLRFLSTTGEGSAKLESWAASELEMVDSRLDAYDAGVRAAEERLKAAKSERDVRDAERQLQTATAVRAAALAPPRPIPLTAEALRSGVVPAYQDIRDINLSAQSFVNTSFQGHKMHGADLSNATFESVCFYETELTHANLSGATLLNCDLRSADFRGANLRNATIRQEHGDRATGARFDAADLSGARIETDSFPVVYDSLTVWPDGFSPDEVDAVSVEVQESI